MQVNLKQRMFDQMPVVSQPGKTPLSCFTPPTPASFPHNALILSGFFFDYEQKR